MFGDTITVTVVSTPYVLVKINQDGYSSEYLYRDSTEEFQMKIRHSEVKAKSELPAMDRHNVELLRTIFGTTGVEDIVTKAYFVFESERSNPDTDLIDALADWAIASSGANLTKLVGWES